MRDRTSGPQEQTTNKKMLKKCVCTVEQNKLLWQNLFTKTKMPSAHHRGWVNLLEADSLKISNMVWNPKLLPNCNMNCCSDATHHEPLPNCVQTASCIRRYTTHHHPTADSIILCQNLFHLYDTFNIFVVFGLPLLSSSLIDSLLLVNSPYHQNIIARDIADWPNTFECFHTFLSHYNRLFSHKTES